MFVSGLWSDESTKERVTKARSSKRNSSGRIGFTTAQYKQNGLLLVKLTGEAKVALVCVGEDRGLTIGTERFTCQLNHARCLPIYQYGRTLRDETFEIVQEDISKRLHLFWLINKLRSLVWVL